ncbi:MAG: DNA-directed RNA polymerase subunit beta' [Patescibacteria group bacterium UBA2103]
MRKRNNLQSFDKMSIGVASPEKILEWSHGEVTKPETINYRTQRSEKHGLFDEKIFGPEKDYECYCGKYKGIRYKGITCDKCGVEITRSVVRRERMGHIELATPVSHIWFLRALPSRMATILGMSSTDLEKVIYFAGYIITSVSEAEKNRLVADLDNEYQTKFAATKDAAEKDRLKELATTTRNEIDSIVVGRVLDEVDYHRYSVKYSTLFEAQIGAEAIFEIFKKLDLVKLKEELEERFPKAGAQEKEKLTKRISLIGGMIKSGVKPEWMFMTRIPVIPPAIRPMVALEGGRHATSDVNDLYRRVINRNNRLKKLMDIHAPEVILRNEKRILQEAVDALLDNSIRRGTGGALNASQRRPLKSLTDYLKGKHGYFRQNLLGKRVDYSGRSVIVVGPGLELDECGLPKHMALELFRPFIIAKLLERELAFNIRGAGRLIEDSVPEVWEILEEVIEGKHVMLNRAPTLHRQGIQAFRPTLIEGNAIQLHPLVCPAFNADFDGDQMAVHVPLSEEAQLEAKEVVSSKKNVLKPGSGDPVISMSHDIALGIFWMTQDVEGVKGEGKAFESPNAAITAHDYGEIDFRAKVWVLPTEDNPKYEIFNGERFETTVGRLLANSIFPKEYDFINEEINKKKLSKILNELIEIYGLDRVTTIADKIKKFGFRYATNGGITWSMSDIKVPEQKAGIVNEAIAKVQELREQYDNGLITRDERKRMSTEIWYKVKEDIEKTLPDTLDTVGSVATMINSGARGTISNLSQMAGMKGLVTNPKGEVIEFPIISSMSEGFTPLEYFMSTHGSRKGLADTALGTAKAGYLTRRLFDVAQDAIITEADCKAKEGITISRESASGIVKNFAEAVVGRTLLADATDSKGNVVLKKGELISHPASRDIEESDVAEVLVRSPMNCQALHGICQKCYGSDLTTREEIDLGEAVGTIAAQAIGEPGTQLTMRTFHAGGIAAQGGDITQGLPRVEEVFDRRQPKSPAVIADCDGKVIEVNEDPGNKTIVVAPEIGEKGKKNDSVTYKVLPARVSLVKVGDDVKKGQLLTDGSANLADLFKLAGPVATKEYIITETSKIYELQGAPVSRKHIEVIIRQMFSRLKVTESGDAPVSRGDIISQSEFAELVAEAKENGTEAPKADPLVLGITDVALTRKSFLSAASFQHTTKVLINASVRGATDTLRGLKENVIIGRLIPAGTGFPGSKKQKMIEELQANREKRLIKEREAREAQMAAAEAEETN